MVQPETWGPHIRAPDLTSMNVRFLPELFLYPSGLPGSSQRQPAHSIDRSVSRGAAHDPLFEQHCGLPPSASLEALLQPRKVGSSGTVRTVPTTEPPDQLPRKHALLGRSAFTSRILISWLLSALQP